MEVLANRATSSIAERRTDKILQGIQSTELRDLTLKAIVEATMVEPGKQLLDSVCSAVSRALGCSTVIIGEIAANDPNTVETLSFYVAGSTRPNTSYTLQGTPCAKVLEEGMFAVCADVARLFPADEMLAAMGLECYVGAPIVSPEGHTIGLIAVMDQRGAPDLAHKAVILRALSPFVATELGRIRLNRLKARFLANVSHEIRTPVSNIIGGLEVLFEPGAKAEVETMAKGMLTRNAQHLRRLIDDVIEISKIESHGLTLKPTTFAIHDAVMEAIHSANLAAARKGIKIVTEFLCSDVTHMTTDRDRLHQILLNILDNAVKYTDVGGINVTCSPYKGHGVTFSVSDTGVGISPDRLASIFDPFMQLELGSGTQRPGSGLGLAICRKLADSLGAELLASSQLGKGSSFTLSFPSSCISWPH